MDKNMVQMRLIDVTERGKVTWVKSSAEPDIFSMTYSDFKVAVIPVLRAIIFTRSDHAGGEQRFELIIEESGTLAADRFEQLVDSVTISVQRHSEIVEEILVELEGASW